MKRVEDYEVCELCHFASGCKKCCRKCKGCGGQQICGLRDPMNVKVNRVEWFKQHKESLKKEKEGGVTIMKKGQQTELPDLPERSPLAKKAIEYLTARNEADEAKQNEDIAKAELVEMFIKSGQTSVKVSGHTVSYSHMETDKIVIKNK